MSGQAIETEIKKCSVTSEMKSQFMPLPGHLNIFKHSMAKHSQFAAGFFINT